MAGGTREDVSVNRQNLPAVQAATGYGSDTVGNDAEARILRAYRATTRDGLRAAILPALGGFVLFALASGAVEAYYFPDRRGELLLLNAVYLTTALLHGLVLRRWPQSTVAATMVAASAIHVSVVAYFASTGGSANLCVMILGAFLTAQLIIYPWNATGQLATSIVPFVAYVIGTQAGMQSSLPAVYPTFALATMVLLTTVGASRLDRHRFEAFRRALLLEWAADEQRSQRAILESLLDLASALHGAIDDPKHMANVLAEHTRRAIHADWVLVHRWLPEAKRYGLFAAAGAPDAAIEEIDALGGSRAWSPLLQAMLAQSGILEVDRDHPVPPLHGGLLARWGIHRLFIRPVARGVPPLGIISCVRSRADIPFTEVERRTLNAIAAQAAIAIENAALVEAARAADRVKSEFVATVSHELRTPLNVILGYTDLILDGTFEDTPEEQTEALRRVRHQSLALLTLIQELLDINRLEARGLTLTLTRFPIASVLDAVRQGLPDSWMKSDVELSWPASVPAVTVRSDFNKLEMVVRNLIHNALKFTDRGTVAISAESIGDDAAVRVIVSDTGIGIQAADLGVVFEMFGQAESGSRSGGFGLGLYIVKRIVDSLGGTVTVDSTPGVGSRFVVTIPATGEA